MNLRARPKHNTDFYMGNDFGVQIFPMPLFTNFKQGLSYFSKEMTQIKKSGAPYGLNQFGKMLFMLPYPLAKYVLYKLASKNTIVVSNVFGPPLPMIINGNIKSSKIQCLIPSANENTGGFILVSHVDTIKISFQCD